MDCPTVAKGAATYLVLAQNRIQQTFDFATFDIDRMRAELRKLVKPGIEMSDLERSVIAEAGEHDFDHADIATYAKRVTAAVSLAKVYVARSSALYTHEDDPLPQFWLVFTEAQFTRYTYSARDGDVMFVSLGYWRTWMAPPSALEFIVRMTQAVCAELFLELPLHYFTKGCLLDFNDHIRDARFMVLVGNVCSVCRARATAAAKGPELAALLALLDKSWVGDTTENLSVASVLKKVYDYDLYVSRGLSANRLETFWDNLTSSSAQEFIRLIAAVLLAYLLLKFGLKSGG